MKRRGQKEHSEQATFKKQNYILTTHTMKTLKKLHGFHYC